MTEEIPIDQANFKNGQPDFQFTKVYNCFKGKGNGLLYRLVNEEAKQWAFYNNTTDTNFRVTALFNVDDQIHPADGATAREVTMDNEKKIEISIPVPASSTVLFIEGEVHGFSLDFSSEAPNADEVAFENGKPDVSYTHKYKCFKNNGNGLLFRLVDEQNQKWYFYNDTIDYRMTATVQFRDKKSVQPLGNTKTQGAPEGSPEGVVFVVEIDPGVTEPFCSGEATNYTVSFAAEPLTNDSPIKPEYENSHPDSSIVGPNAKVFKCYKKHGNGLLFRLVDEEKKLWAFYNDTASYVFTAKVTFAPGEVYTPSPNATQTSDPQTPGGSILTMDIPPLTTLLFLEGLPVVYEINFENKDA